MKVRCSPPAKFELSFNMFTPAHSSASAFHRRRSVVKAQLSSARFNSGAMSTTGAQEASIAVWMSKGGAELCRLGRLYFAASEHAMHVLGWPLHFDGAGAMFRNPSRTLREVTEVVGVTGKGRVCVQLPHRLTRPWLFSMGRTTGRDRSRSGP